LPLDRQAQRFLTMLAAGQGEGGYRDAAQRRRALEDLAGWTAGDPPEVAEVRDVELAKGPDPIRARLYAPIGADDGALPGLVFFHGGGWVAGGLETHDGVCRRLANASGCRVVAVDYRLAPEHPFPAAFEDSKAAVQAIAETGDTWGIDTNRLGLAGDSAGGGLVAALCQAARRDGPTIRLQLLICPILDVATESRSRIDLAEGYFLDRATLERDLELYAPPDRGDVRVSPLGAADLSGLPPAVIHTAEFDPFRDEGEAYAARLAAAGGAVSLTRHDGMIHYFYAMPRVIRYAETALEAIGAAVRERLRGGA
jgi:acetyl esterase/lipase